MIPALTGAGVDENACAQATKRNAPGRCGGIFGVPPGFEDSDGGEDEPSREDAGDAAASELLADVVNVGHDVPSGLPGIPTRSPPASPGSAPRPSMGTMVLQQLPQPPARPSGPKREVALGGHALAFSSPSGISSPAALPLPPRSPEARATSPVPVEAASAASPLSVASSPSRSPTRVAPLPHGVENVPSQAPTEAQESESERLARELEESEALARQLMAEEALEVYSMARDNLLQNASDYSEQDMQLLRALMAEETPEAEGPRRGDGVHALQTSRSEELTYDRLLQLGDVIGDVKEERWKGRAEAIIADIPTASYCRAMSEPPTFNNTRCLVCQCGFEEGEELRVLPCGHFYHGECVDEWLRRKDTCPACMESVDPEERQAAEAKAAAEAGHSEEKAVQEG